jgi:peroxiredoxin Q/BCP
MKRPYRALRRLIAEPLEQRFLCASDWQNASLPLDVNRSGSVEPVDALVVINNINANGMRALGSKPADYDGPLLDTNGDGSVSAMDVLLVINSFNRPAVGQLAPNVRLPNQDGEMVDLASFRGKNAVVLYFYPKDNTPGCTVEALDFSDRNDQIEALGAKVFGVSLDPVDSKKQFSDLHKLNFDILADADRQVTTSYGALTETSSGMPIARRTTYIIGADGVIKKIYTDVDVKVHGGQVVAALEAGIQNS